MIYFTARAHGTTFIPNADKFLTLQTQEKTNLVKVRYLLQQIANLTRQVVESITGKVELGQGRNFT